MVSEAEHLIRRMRPHKTLDTGILTPTEPLLEHFSTSILEKVLFLAPTENPVPQLLNLREKESAVYLL